MYTIAPVKELHKAQQVHRDMLKPHVTSVAQPLGHHLPAVPGESFESSEDGELLLLACQTTGPLTLGTPVPPHSSRFTEPSPIVTTLPSARPECPREDVTHSTGQPNPPRVTLHRNVCPTAGHHSNMHHLSWSVAMQGNKALEPV